MSARSLARLTLHCAVFMAAVGLLRSAAAEIPPPLPPAPVGRVDVTPLAPPVGAEDRPATEGADQRSAVVAPPAVAPHKKRIRRIGDPCAPVDHRPAPGVRADDGEETATLNPQPLPPLNGARFPVRVTRSTAAGGEAEIAVADVDVGIAEPRVEINGRTIASPLPPACGAGTR